MNNNLKALFLFLTQEKKEKNPDSFHSSGQAMHLKRNSENVSLYFCLDTKVPKNQGYK